MLYNTATDSDGYFSTALLSESDFVIVAVSGGQDTDANDDGVPGDSVQNTGTIYALMTADQFAAGNFIVSAITDIAYQYTKNLIGQADNSWLQTRLNDVAKIFFISDLNGDGTIDSKDLLMFVPTDAAHKSKLSFDYQSLFTPDDSGNSIIKAYHDNLSDMLLTLLDSKFGINMTLYPTTDSRYQKVKVEIGMFGRGSVKSNIGGIDVNSERQNQADNVTKAFFDKSSTGKVTLTATPASETQILSWNGCDTVSQDNTQCECNLTADHLISLSFGYKETKLKDDITLVDLKDVSVTISSDMITLDVTANTGDIDMVSKLNALKNGDVVVGSAGNGFLRRIVSVQKVSDYNYILTTTDVSLEEVIAKGTGTFFKQMTYGDLIQDTSARSVRSGSQISGFEGIEGVRLVPSDDPNNRVFKIMIGDPDSHTRASADIGATWKMDDGNEITVSGGVELTFDFETGCSFNNGLEHFKFIPKINTKQTLNVSVGGEISTPKDCCQQEIGTIKFKKVYLQIGPLPVFVTPEVKIYCGVNAKITAELTTGVETTQSLKGGIIYNRTTGARIVSGFDYSGNFNRPSMKFEGETAVYIKLGPGMTIYSITGPSIPLKTYLKVKGEAQQVLSSPCLNPKWSFAATLGIDAEFEWKLGPLEKILGKWADKIDLDYKLGFINWTPAKWEIADGNSLCMNFVLIPAGTFMMGSPKSDIYAYNDEKPQHQVRVSSFYMQTTEVTQGQWKAVMGSNPSYFTACGDNCPVENVLWDDIKAFITKLNQRGEGTYRLPWEKEWEYAARAGTSTLFAFGNCLSTDQANYDGRYPLSGCSDGLSRGKTMPVMSFAPNAFGLYDMHGNVWEMVQDWCCSIYPDIALSYPNPLFLKVLRGGSYGSPAAHCRSAHRESSFHPTLDVGFRLVRVQ